MTEMNWTPEEEAIIARIMATESMHNPFNTYGDRRVSCSRPEALRRLQSRKRNGIYREPTNRSLTAFLPVDPKAHSFEPDEEIDYVAEALAS